MKNSNDTIGNRTRDFPAGSAVPQLRHRVPPSGFKAPRNPTTSLILSLFYRVFRFSGQRKLAEESTFARLNEASWYSHYLQFHSAKNRNVTFVLLLDIIRTTSKNMYGRAAGNASPG